ncbi:pilus assembly FimT family protein [Aquabacterium sp.]|uniref:pilus assembly FimT family protein n=1 Tax=Aquabacterium sp. TaxID=1872578 RepID=UPI002B6A4254|nr:prepilin-type N-terminal cleavage/methylation domain-containing protein [Aquabacterium sp.]HSW07799.1 prepilin-type N-terminal cleavage/methylation domain-containing protein [Aquabacterium sp.]
MRQLNTRRGVTLIELMVGLVIMAVLTGMAAPFFGDYITNSRLREGGNALMAEALYAQSEALKRNGVVRLSITGTATQVIDMTQTVPATLRTRTFTQGLAADALNIDFGSDGMTRPRGTDVVADMSIAGVTCSSEQRCPRLRIDAGGAILLCGNKLSCP